MEKIKGIKYIYTIIIIFMMIVCVIGSTYAYLSSSAISNNDIVTSSSNYNVSLRITPIYSDFSLIPMDDDDAMKALKNQCKDKYNRGACNLYSINVYGYAPSITAISGKINTNLSNIVNLSYMVLEEVNYDINDNDNCITISTKNYCIVKEATMFINNTDMSLGDNYSVIDFESKNLLLAIWLTNLNEDQNSFDIGNYSSTVTILLGGDGGQISGSINGTLENYNDLQGGE